MCPEMTASRTYLTSDMTMTDSHKNLSVGCKQTKQTEQSDTGGGENERN